MDCSRPDKAAIYPNDNIVALIGSTTTRI